MSKKKKAKTAKTTKARIREHKTTRKKSKPADTAAKLVMPPKTAKVDITAAKGRPMLSWVGKRPLAHVTAFPAQLVERHDALRIVGIDPQNIDTLDEKMQLFSDLRSQCNEKCWENAPFIGTRAPEVGGLLLHGDNKDILAYLLAKGFRGKVQLVYIDPPFDSGADYIRNVTLRGSRGSAKLQGDNYALGEQVQYADIWANDNYLQFMYERLQLIRELLSDNGTFYLHCDWHRNHHLRALADEVFGASAFLGEIVWKRSDSHNDATFYGVVHDTLFAYANSDATYFNRVFLPISQNTADKWYRHIEENTGRRYNLGNLVSPHPRPNLMYKWRGIDPPAMGWRCSKDRMSEYDNKGLLVEVGKGDKRTLKIKQYLDESKGRLLSTWWDDISQLRGYSGHNELTDYPTQKPVALLKRIIDVSSRPGDLVLDCFCGSGTSVVAAQCLGRRWIGCDINKGAIQTTVKRLRGIISEQIQAAQKAAAATRQGKLFDKETDVESQPPKPCAFGFTVWRVNDYDLAIQHNEAVNLACEHIGIQRTRSDSYFDGTLGKRLVKIVPFGHPLTPLDLEELRRELDSRPDEDRNIVLVCLGMELAAQGWIDDWNRLRKGESAVNKIDVVELRTDPKYGRFIKHEPASAKVKITRKKRGGEARIVVEVQDFISPTIVERLQSQAGLLAPKIDDWRAMVDCIYIDSAYRGAVLNVVLADVPERKADFVSGAYELTAPEDETTVAVKIIDMLGEEVLVTKVV